MLDRDSPITPMCQSYSFTKILQISKKVKQVKEKSKKMIEKKTNFLMIYSLLGYIPLINLKMVLIDP